MLPAGRGWAPLRYSPGSQCDGESMPTLGSPWGLLPAQRLVQAGARGAERDCAEPPALRSMGTAPHLCPTPVRGMPPSHPMPSCRTQPRLPRWTLYTFPCEWDIHHIYRDTSHVWHSVSSHRSSCINSFSSTSRRIPGHGAALAPAEPKGHRSRGRCCFDLILGV